MTLLQALILAVIQGVGELFPVSSLAQTILIPAVLKWDLNQQNSDFLAFVVALHLATAIALVLYFWKDWKTVLLSYSGSVQRGKLVYDADSKFAWLLVAGTIVVGAVGLAFEKKFRVFFDDPSVYWIVAIILIINGILMLLGDYLKRKASLAISQQKRNASELSWIEGTTIGAAQTLALVPGVSRGGVTIVAGLLAGLSYEEASRFSFMLATPVIGLAALLKVPTLLKYPHELGLAIPASLLAGVTAYLSVAFLMKYFKEHHRLAPFGYFCIIFGGMALAILKSR